MKILKCLLMIVSHRHLLQFYSNEKYIGSQIYLPLRAREYIMKTTRKTGRYTL